MLAVTCREYLPFLSFISSVAAVTGWTNRQTPAFVPLSQSRHPPACSVVLAFHCSAGHPACDSKIMILHLLAKPLRKKERFRLAHVVQDDELFPAPPAEQVAMPKYFLYDFIQLPENIIPCFVPVKIIDVFEMIQIEKDN